MFVEVPLETDEEEEEEAMLLVVGWMVPILGLVRDGDRDTAPRSKVRRCVLLEVLAVVSREARMEEAATGVPGTGEALLVVLVVLVVVVVGEEDDRGADWSWETNIMAAAKSWRRAMSNISGVTVVGVAGVVPVVVGGVVVTVFVVGGVGGGGGEGTMVGGVVEFVCDVGVVDEVVAALVRRLDSPRAFL